MFRARNAPHLGFALLVPLSGSSFVFGGITADQVTAYSIGSVPANAPVDNNLSAPLGPLNGDTGFGSGLNPFNPPYDPSQILAVYGTGTVTLHLSATVAGNGQVGVFTNTGIENVGSSEATAGSPVTTLGQTSQAIVSVSSDGTHFVPLFGGAVQNLDAPTNFWLDAPITLDQFGNAYYADQGLGTQAANPFKPFAPDTADPLSLFNGLTYSQMLSSSVLNGSAGGTWFDLAGSGLSSVNYIRFDVPVNDRLVLDSISAVPEPTTIGAVLVLAAMPLLRRRK
jgi:hypothetical protein